MSLREIAFAIAGCILAGSCYGQSTCPTVTPLSQTNQVTTTSFFYDPLGNVVQTCDPSSTAASQIYTSQAFDGLNRITSVVEPIPGTTGSHPIIQTTYDERDQVVQVSDPRSNNTTYTIDGLGNLTLLASPDTGSTTNTFDAVGNLKTSKDARGDTTTYSYDGLNRVTSIVYASGTSTNFTYDGGSAPVQYDKGHLTGISDESGSTRLYYDGRGRTVKKIQISFGSATSTQESQTVSYIYSEAGSTTGKLVSITYPSGNVVGYTYDGAGRIERITLTPVGGSASTVISNITYNPFGAATGWTWGNGSVYARTFDYDGRLASFPLGQTTGSKLTPNALTRTNNYDGASRIVSITHVDTSGSGTSAIALADNASYGYDNLNRLTAYTAATTSQTYGYDLTGNRTGLSIGSSNYTYGIAPKSNQLNTTTGPSPARSNAYDADGNLTGDGTYQYSYSARGRMTATGTTGSGTIASYLYNGIGQRTYRSGSTSFIPTGAVRYMYDEAGHLLGEYDIHAQAIEETIYLGDTPIAVVTPEGPVIVADNSDSTVVTVGTWSSSTTDPGYFGPNYQYYPINVGPYSFTWPLTIPTTGTYHVYARWTADTNRSTQAAYTVGSSTAVHENQTKNGGAWQLLGSFALTSGTTNVKLVPDSTGYVIADAVKAVLVSEDGFAVNYIYPDQIDAPRMITRPVDNQMVWRWDQADPFGSAPPNQNPAGLGAFVYNARFPGQLFDFESSLNYNYSRNYDPTLGRYVQSDPIGLWGGMNPYAYAAGNPVHYIDPLGLDIIVITGGVRDSSANVFGHVAAAVQGFGMASYGNDTDLGSSVGDYLASQGQFRAQQVTIIPTSPSQDALAIAYIKAHPNKNGVGLLDNCAVRTNQLLNYAGVPTADIPYPGGVATDAATQPGATTYYIPQGAPIPPALAAALPKFAAPR